ncbi:MAG: TetR/AcrR family transcriptional regulator [Gemmatimonadetes bacterium]|nr:TetR/AcrR family transcriptional regulator [Gemmatimonadota bacterium]
MNTANKTRDYRSPLRREQAEQTREKILDAVVEEMSEGGLHTFSVAAAARRAGVAERTVYRHFPDLEALIEGLDTRFAALNLQAEPERPEELPEAPSRLFALFDAHENLVRARLQTDLGQEVRRRERAKRARWLQGVLEEATEHLSSAGRRRVAAVLHHLVSSESWRMMKDEFGFDGAESGLAVGWAVGLIVAALRDGDTGVEGAPGSGDGSGNAEAT